MRPVDVERLRLDDVPRIVGVLSEAFRDYPVMRFVLGAVDPEYDRRLARLVGFFVMARALRDEPLLGIPDGGDLAAAAIVSFPGVGESPPRLALLREEVWAELGAEARSRYEACGEAWRPLGVTVPHIHLNMIGVRSAFQGKGYAKRLLDHVHEMSRETPGSLGVTLTTEDPENVALYLRMGYDVVGQARVASNLETWSFFRRDPP